VGVEASVHFVAFNTGLALDWGCSMVCGGLGLGLR
jgi:hypothetical protein